MQHRVQVALPAVSTSTRLIHLDLDSVDVSVDVGSGVYRQSAPCEKPLRVP